MGLAEDMLATVQEIGADIKNISTRLGNVEGDPADIAVLDARLDTVEAVLPSKASASTVTTLEGRVANLESNPGGVTSVAGRGGAITLTTVDIGGLDPALAAKADLVNGKVPTSQIPAVATGDIFPVASQAQMLALTAQVGDVAIRTDLTTARRFLLTGDPSVLSDWVRLNEPQTAGVQSVNNQTGNVTLGAADVGAVGTADPRLTDARSPTAHKNTHATGGVDALTPADIGAAAVSDLVALAGRVTTLENKPFDVEAAQDAAAAMLGGVGTYNDAANAYTITLPAPRTDEEIQDVVAALIQAGGSLSKTYDDAGNILSLSVTATSSGPTTRTLSGTTASLAAGASANLDLANPTDARNRKVVTSVALRYAVYGSDADRTADNTRFDAGTLAEPTNVRLLAQGYTTAGDLSNAHSFDLNGPAYIRVQNTSGAAAALTITLTVEDA